MQGFSSELEDLNNPVVKKDIIDLAKKSSFLEKEISTKRNFVASDWQGALTGNQEF